LLYENKKEEAIGLMLRNVC